MTREEWEQGIQKWQQSGGREGSKAPEAATSPTGWLGSAGGFLKGAGRELATQGGFAKDFAQGEDPNHTTAEWAGRKAVDFAPALAVDAFAPEFAPFAAATRLGRLGNAANEAIYSGVKGAVGGAAASPEDRQGGATTGGEIGAGGSVLGNIVSSSPVKRMLLPAAIAAEIAQHGGVLPHGMLGGLYPWTIAHGLSALAGLARAAGIHAPAKAGAVGSQVQRSLNDGD